MVYNPRGTRTRRERLKKDVKTFPFAACTVSVVDDINVNLIYRNLACFAGRDFYIVGSKKWHKGATNGLEDIINIKYFQSFNEFLRYIKTETTYQLVSIEQCENSITMDKVEKYPDNPCFIFGNEGFGLGDDVLLQSRLAVEIPMDGFHPSLNVGCASGIAFYDFVRKNG